METISELDQINNAIKLIEEQYLINQRAFYHKIEPLLQMISLMPVMTPDKNLSNRIRMEFDNGFYYTPYGRAEQAQDPPLNQYSAEVANIGSNFHIISTNVDKEITNLKILDEDSPYNKKYISINVSDKKAYIVRNVQFDPEKFSNIIETLSNILVYQRKEMYLKLQNDMQTLSPFVDKIDIAKYKLEQL